MSAGVGYLPSTELKSKHVAPGLSPLITHIFTAQILHVLWFWGLKVGKLGGLEMIFLFQDPNLSGSFARLKTRNLPHPHIIQQGLFGKLR